MHAALNPFLNSQRIAIVVACLLGAGFMLWFLVALVLEGRRLHKRVWRFFPVERPESRLAERVELLLPLESSSTVEGVNESLG